MLDRRQLFLVCFIVTMFGATAANLACAGGWVGTEPTNCDDPFRPLASGRYTVDGAFFGGSETVDIAIDRAEKRVDISYPLDGTARTQTWRIDNRTTVYRRD